MTEVSSNQPSEEQIQATCPPFCERTTHYNLGTPEDQYYVHDTAEHVVHGMRLRITVLTNELGEEDEPLGIAINDEELSLREVRDLMNALSEALYQAAMTDTEAREALDRDDIGGPDGSARLGLIAEHANHQRHLRARETRKAHSIDLRTAQ